MVLRESPQISQRGEAAHREGTSAVEPNSAVKWKQMICQREPGLYSACGQVVLYSAVSSTAPVLVVLRGCLPDCLKTVQVAAVPGARVPSRGNQFTHERAAPGLRHRCPAGHP